jgi:hypothetical protein
MNCQIDSCCLISANISTQRVRASQILRQGEERRCQNWTWYVGSELSLSYASLLQEGSYSQLKTPWQEGECEEHVRIWATQSVVETYWKVILGLWEEMNEEKKMRKYGTGILKLNYAPIIA